MPAYRSTSTLSMVSESTSSRVFEGQDDDRLYIRVFLFNLESGEGHILRESNARFLWKLTVRDRLVMVHMPNFCHIHLIDIHSQVSTLVNYSEIKVGM